MDTQTREFYIEDLIGSRIVSSERQYIGHVVDVEVSPGPERRVTGLLYGRASWLYRLHILHPVQHSGLPAEIHVIPWRAVADFQRFIVTLKPDWQAEERGSGRPTRGATHPRRSPL